MRYHITYNLFVLLLLFFTNMFAQTSPVKLPAGDQEGPSDSPLIRALAERNDAHARELLASGASPNRMDRFGMTPLSTAIIVHNSDFARLLVQKGADVNLPAANGTSPLMTAAWYCDITTVRLLLEHGADVKLKNQDGESALGAAADACRNRDMVKLLVAHGAEVNAKTKLSRTPLIEAAFSGNEPAVRELVQAGAELRAKDENGETAESSACQRQIGRKEDHDKICTFLRGIAEK